MYRLTHDAKEQLNVVKQQICSDGYLVNLTVERYNRTTIIHAWVDKSRSRKVLVIRQQINPSQLFERLEAMRLYLDGGK